MLGYITKHLEVRQKYYARVVFLEIAVKYGLSCLYITFRDFLWILRPVFLHENVIVCQVL